MGTTSLEQDTSHRDESQKYTYFLTTHEEIECSFFARCRGLKTARDPRVVCMRKLEREKGMLGASPRDPSTVD